MRPEPSPRREAPSSYPGSGGTTRTRTMPSGSTRRRMVASVAVTRARPVMRRGRPWPDWEDTEVGLTYQQAKLLGLEKLHPSASRSRSPEQELIDRIEPRPSVRAYA